MSGDGTWILNQEFGRSSKTVASLILLAEVLLTSDGESDLEGIENQQSVTHLQERYLTRKKLSCPNWFLIHQRHLHYSLQWMVQHWCFYASTNDDFKLPASKIQAETKWTQSDQWDHVLVAQPTETNEHETEDWNTGRCTSGQVRKSNQVDERCECDTEVTTEEKDEGTEREFKKSVSLRVCACMDYKSV